MQVTRQPHLHGPTDNGTSPYDHNNKRENKIDKENINVYPGFSGYGILPPHDDVIQSRQYDHGNRSKIKTLIRVM